MSKLIDRLTRVSQAAAHPMGFRAARSAAAMPRMQLVAALAKADANASDYVVGADAGLVRVAGVDSGARAIKKAADAVQDIPWGAWLEAHALGQLGQVSSLNCDFVVFPAAGTALAVPPAGGPGMVLQVDSSVPEGQLRTANDLAVDAVLVTAEQEGPGPLTWHQLMLWRRFAGLLTAPLLVCIPNGTGTDELQLLWEAGIGGVVVAAGPDSSPGELKRLREAIDGLAPPSPRKKRHSEALLPRMERAAEPAVEIGEEDEDEDD